MEFEQAMKELENIVKILEEGKSPLKESVNL
ncbi:MAG: exodeoxyribonuclease VII small subunit, partial [Holosporaceae bacterium]|nr:exodeoxyribonuclease VII small subunit [Holosporaceae bacterium]